MLITAPDPVPEIADKPVVFLAGTIDMGNSEDWQERIGNKLSELDIIVLNPRRREWNADWEQSVHNPQFCAQVNWELDGLKRANCILFHFAAGSQSPVTLLELGLYASTGKCLVHCPTGFWRKGNVDMVCLRYAIPTIEHLDQAPVRIRELLNLHFGYSK